MRIKRMTTIASVAALTVAAFTPEANASSVFERALLASGATEIEAAIQGRPRTSGAPVTNETLIIRTANIAEMKEKGVDNDFLDRVREARENALPLPSAYRFLKAEEEAAARVATEEEAAEAARVAAEEAARVAAEKEEAEKPEQAGGASAAEEEVAEE